MPRGKLGPTLEEVKALPAEDRHFLRPLVQAVVQELCPVALGAGLASAPGLLGRSAAMAWPSAASPDRSGLPSFAAGDAPTL